jgi:hypothetical protein
MFGRSRYGQMQRRVVIPIGVGIIFIAVLGGAFVRYNGPISVVRAYLQDTYDNEFASALNYVCPGKGGENLRAYLGYKAQRVEADKQLQAQGFADAGIPPIHIDLSRVSFAVREESWESPTVRYTGVAHITQSQRDAPTLTYTIVLQGARQVHANGLWWCVSDPPN